MPPKLKRHSVDESSRRTQKLPHQRRTGTIQPSTMAVQALREHSSALSSNDVAGFQRTLGNQRVSRVLIPSAVQRNAAPRLVIQRDSYPYGAANSVPHVHEYHGDCHLKIVDRGRVRRYNIIQNGRRHNQADDAIAAAAGNQALLDVINGLLEDI